MSISLANIRLPPDSTPNESLQQPVRLSDEQMAAIWAAAHPLPRDRWSDFLADVAREVAALPMVRNGSLYEVIMTVQRKYFDPPVESGGNGKPRGAGKYSR